MSKRVVQLPMKVIARFVYDPEKADRGLRAMADIIASAIRSAPINDVVPVEPGPR